MPHLKHDGASGLVLLESERHVTPVESNARQLGLDGFLFQRGRGQVFDGVPLCQNVGAQQMAQLEDVLG